MELSDFRIRKQGESFTIERKIIEREFRFALRMSVRKETWVQAGILGICKGYIGYTETERITSLAHAESLVKGWIKYWKSKESSEYFYLPLKKQ